MKRARYWHITTERKWISWVEHTMTKETLKNLGYDKDYKINYGYNYFPKKKYKSVTYKEGMYESLVITLGTGEGDNWWCVLFPPLCLVEADESTVAVSYTHLTLPTNSIVVISVGGGSIK